MGSTMKIGLNVFGDKVAGDNAEIKRQGTVPMALR